MGGGRAVGRLGLTMRPASRGGVCSRFAATLPGVSEHPDSPPLPPPSLPSPPHRNLVLAGHQEESGCQEHGAPEVDVAALSCRQRAHKALLVGGQGGAHRRLVPRAAKLAGGQVDCEQANGEARCGRTPWRAVHPPHSPLLPACAPECRGPAQWPWPPPPTTSAEQLWCCGTPAGRKGGETERCA